MGGGIVGAVWSCVCHLGFTQTLEMLAEEPGFLDRLIAALLAQAREQVAYYARCGSDIVFVDESGATGDLISPAHYERFGLPFTRAVVEEIHRRGMKAIVYYFGAAMDRLAQIAETRADAVLVECSMKGYTNDIDRIARAIGDRVSLFGNLDPVWTLERGPESLLAREVDRQVEAGRGARGFLLSTGSPITPGVPLARVRRFIELGRERATR